MVVSAWVEVATAKRTTRDVQIDKYRPHTREASQLAAKIVDITDLTDMLNMGTVSAEDIIRAYIERACEAQRMTNCLTEICFGDALDQARELDRFQLENGKLLGPLHGVPISVKDQVDLKGLDSTLGYVANVSRPAESDAHLVQTLKAMGAIIIAKTNLPQSIMWCETNNPLWGLTTHPLSPDLTPGGSSGGEAALLSLAGSLVGWGTDIGGSIRIPSHMNGLWGLKPSQLPMANSVAQSGRMSYRGVAVTLEGQQHVPSALGPMARSLSSLTQITKLVINAAPWITDPDIPPVPWKDTILADFKNKKLVIGVMPDDGIVGVHPPIARVFAQVVAKAEAAGHEVVTWPTHMNTQCLEIMDQYYAADGGEDIRAAVAAGGEPFIPQIEAFVNRGQPISVYQYWQLSKRKVAAQRAYHDMWDRTRSPSGRSVDVLLIPTMPHTAVPHGSCKWTGYTKLFNFLDYTALTFPAGKACRDMDTSFQSCLQRCPRNPIDAFVMSLYKPEEMENLPVGLQIVGRRFEEEKVLGAAYQFQSLL